MDGCAACVPQHVIDKLDGIQDSLLSADQDFDFDGFVRAGFPLASAVTHSLPAHGFCRIDDMFSSSLGEDGMLPGIASPNPATTAAGESSTTAPTDAPDATSSA